MRRPPLHMLLSRVAESAYWAGRYIERAEGTARLIKTHADLIVDLPREATVGWSPLLALLGFDDAFLTRRDQTVGEESVVALLTTDATNPSSVRSCIASVHQNLRIARAVMPVEAVEILTDLHNFVEATGEASLDRRTRGSWLAKIIRDCQTLSAALADTMSHDDAYCFFTIGRQLERADLTTRVIDTHQGVLTRRVSPALEPYVDLCWASSLLSVSALQPFRRTGVASSAEATVDFLLNDSRCPRTVEHCLVEAARWLLEIPGHELAMASCASAQKLLQEAEPAVLIDGDLHGFIDDLQLALASVHSEMAATWFDPAPMRIAS